MWSHSSICIKVPSTNCYQFAVKRMGTLLLRAIHTIMFGLQNNTIAGRCLHGLLALNVVIHQYYNVFAVGRLPYRRCAGHRHGQKHCKHHLQGICACSVYTRNSSIEQFSQPTQTQANTHTLIPIHKIVQLDHFRRHSPAHQFFFRYRCGCFDCQFIFTKTELLYTQLKK